MRVPPRWVRRVVIAPLVVVLAVLLVVVDPVLLILALAFTAMLPGFLRLPRVLLLVTLYFLWDATVLIVLFGLWIGSGFGWGIRRPAFLHAHYRVAAVALRVLFALFLRLLRLRIVIEGSADPGVTDSQATTDAGAAAAASFTRLFAPGNPLIVASRHAGPGDSFILVHTLLNGVSRNPRIVLKDTMQWDPAIDVMLNRLPMLFITPSGFARSPRGGGHVVEESVGRLAVGMGRDDAFVIFPEGGNFTSARRRRRIERLREAGRTAMARRAERLVHVMAPQPGGMNAALASAPTADVVFVGHTGLDRLVTIGDIWRELPMDKEIVMHAWHVPRAGVPADRDRQAEWLFDAFARIDTWIGEKADGGEPAAADGEEAPGPEASDPAPAPAPPTGSRDAA